MLPIWIGEAEATWLAPAVEKPDLPRPGPHALLAHVIQALGGRLLEVRISRPTGEVFYAEVVCEDGRGAKRSIDPRPSDALNLAAFLHAPILAAPEVIEVAGTGPAGKRMRRVLTEQRAEVVDAGTAELVAEATRALELHR